MLLLHTFSGTLLLPLSYQERFTVFLITIVFARASKFFSLLMSGAWTAGDLVCTAGPAAEVGVGVAPLAALG